jgi:cysteine dioxygenase
MFLTLIKSIERELLINKEDFSSEKIKNYINDYQYQKEFDHYLSNTDSSIKIKIYENDLFDVYIIVWNSYEKSKIHNHAENGCWLKVLKGKLQENLYDSNLNSIDHKIIKEGDLSFIKNSIGYHNIINKENEKALTLHIYSPKDHKTNYY